MRVGVRLLCVSMALALVAAGAGVLRAQREPASFVVGPNFKKALEDERDLAWDGQSLKKAMRGLVDNSHVAALLDRRIDPDQSVHLELNATPLREVFERLAQQGQAAACVCGDVVFLGPPETTRELRTLAALRAEEARQAPEKLKRALLARQPWEWTDFAEPRRLVEQLAATAGLAVDGLDRIPHDLWGAATLPPATVVDRLTLVLIQYDLTYRFDAAAGKLVLVPVPSPVRIERRYPGGPNAKHKASKMRQAAPEADIEIANGQIVVRGRLEDHERFSASGTLEKRPPNQQGPAVKGRDPKRSLTVQNGRLGAVLDKLRAAANLDIRVDEASLKAKGLSLDARVTFAVKDVALDELLAAIFKDTGLAFRRQDRVVEVYAP